MKLTQENFQKHKDALDAVIEGVERLAAAAKKAGRLACKEEQLDLRDTLGGMRAELLHALGSLEKARSLGGGVKGDNITRGGGT